MNFGFSEEQELLRSEVRKFLDEQCPMDEVRHIAATAEGYSPELWKRLGELGWLGLIVPEEYGGAGLGWVDLVVLLEETGRSLFPSPMISNMLAAAALLCGLLVATELEMSALLAPPGASTVGVRLYTLIHNAPESLVAASALVVCLAVAPVLALLALVITGGIPRNEPRTPPAPPTPRMPRRLILRRPA